jgi:hypothetical protein
VRQHRVRRVAEQRQPPAASPGQRRPVVQSPLEAAAARLAGALAVAGPDSIEAKFEFDPPATGLDGVIRAQIKQLDEPILEVLNVPPLAGGAGPAAAPRRPAS